tara:strand:+ start:19121 stop:19453 length:333 start_codon:yes stop_codon:yes gene_type:complete
MIAWAKQNAATLAAWAAMLATLAVTTAQDHALDQEQTQRHEVAIVELKASDQEQSAELIKVKSDLRSVSEAQSRLEVLVTRTEATVREMQTLTAELRAMVVVMRGSQGAK